MALLLKADGTQTEIEPKSGPYYDLEELQGYVGGYIEIVPTTNTKQMLVINEEGKLKGTGVNVGATVRYKWGRHDPIVGDAVLLLDEELER